MTYSPLDIDKLMIRCWHRISTYYKKKAAIIYKYGGHLYRALPNNFNFFDFLPGFFIILKR